MSSSNPSSQKIRNITMIIVFLFVIFSLALLNFIPQKITEIVYNEVQQSAGQRLVQFREMRRYYSENIIAKLNAHKDSHPSISASMLAAIPVPTTMTTDLSDALSKHGVALRLYSPYPFFANGATPVHLPKHDAEVWQWLNDNPEGTYAHIANFPDDPRNHYLHVAIADVMSPSCVACHNKHAKSPKTDWQVGQVRGALEIKQNVTKMVQQSRQLGYIVIGGILTLLTLTIVLALALSRQYKSVVQNEFLAAHDVLTGLLNRAGLESELSHLMRHTLSAQSLHAMFYIDLDDFKKINDELGHDAGDQLLKATAKRFAHIMGPNDLAARIGGDEFIIIKPFVKQDTSLLEKVADDICTHCSTPIMLQGTSTEVNCSIGITPANTAQLKKHGLDTWLDTADKAMLLAKKQGKNCFQLTPLD